MSKEIAMKVSFSIIKTQPKLLTFQGGCLKTGSRLNYPVQGSTALIPTAERGELLPCAPAAPQLCNPQCTPNPSKVRWLSTSGYIIFIASSTTVYSNKQPFINTFQASENPRAPGQQLELMLLLPAGRFSASSGQSEALKCFPEMTPSQKQKKNPQTKKP